jgi:hypothetical protein
LPQKRGAVNKKNVFPEEAFLEEEKEERTRGFFTWKELSISK